jgi:hypothetical protein
MAAPVSLLNKFEAPPAFSNAQITAMAGAIINGINVPAADAPALVASASHPPQQPMANHALAMPKPVPNAQVAAAMMNGLDKYRATAFTGTPRMPVLSVFH